MEFGNQGEDDKTDGEERRGNEVTPGGSEILPWTDAPRLTGEAPKGTERNQRLRERVYEEFLGPCETVYHEISMEIPHVDIYTHPPGHSGREFYTLITGGMSDMPMTVPQGLAMSRAELVMYVEEPKKEYLELLRFLAHFPHDHHTWFGFGHTFPNGQPPVPLFEGSELDTILMADTIIRPDTDMSESLQIGDEPVYLLWVVPITTAECALKLQKGVDALLDIFNQVQHPVVLNEKRRSYV